jgi:hypothetical protein
MTEYTNDGGASSPADVLAREHIAPSGAVFRHYRCDPPVAGSDGGALDDLVIAVRRDGSAYVLAADRFGMLTGGPEVAEYPGPITHEEALQRVARVGGEP